MTLPAGKTALVTGGSRSIEEAAEPIRRSDNSMTPLFGATLLSA